MTDEALVAAFVAGDTAAYDELVRRYAGRVYGICLRYFRVPSDAEDAAQDAFVALFRRAGTFQATAAFSTWMYRVATNACNDMARRRARRPRAAGVDVEVLAEMAQVEDLLANRELGLELERALDALDLDQRTPVVLHDVGGLAYEEIAERLGLPVGTVKSRIHRGHARLAATLAHLKAPAGEPSGPIEPPTMQP